MKIVDLGCGTGELTARLAVLSPGCEIVGIDSSSTMLEKARALACPDLRFEQGRIEDWSAEGAYDPRLQPRDAPVGGRPRGALREVRPRARSREDSSSCRCPPTTTTSPTGSSARLAAASPWKERLAGWERISPVRTIDWYAELLHGLGLERPEVLEKVYGHVLADGLERGRVDQGHAPRPLHGEARGARARVPPGARGQDRGRLHGGAVLLRFPADALSQPAATAEPPRRQVAMPGGSGRNSTRQVGAGGLASWFNTKKRRRWRRGRKGGDGCARSTEAADSSRAARIFG